MMVSTNTKTWTSSNIPFSNKNLHQLQKTFMKQCFLPNKEMWFLRCRSLLWTYSFIATTGGKLHVVIPLRGASDRNCGQLVNHLDSIPSVVVSDAMPYVVRSLALFVSIFLVSNKINGVIAIFRPRPSIAQGKFLISFNHREHFASQFSFEGSKPIFRLNEVDPILQRHSAY